MAGDACWRAQLGRLAPDPDQACPGPTPTCRAKAARLDITRYGVTLSITFPRRMVKSAFGPENNGCAIKNQSAIPGKPPGRPLLAWGGCAAHSDWAGYFGVRRGLCRRECRWGRSPSLNGFRRIVSYFSNGKLLTQWFLTGFDRSQFIPSMAETE